MPSIDRATQAADILTMPCIDQPRCHEPTTTLTPPLKWHGGKQYLARKIVDRMPRHTHYVEPYAGGLAVLLAKNPEGVSEVANDLHRDLTIFWRVLQNTNAFEQFVRIVQAMPFSEIEWEEANNSLRNAPDADPVRRAVWFFIACRQSLAGRLEAFAPLSRTRTRRGMNEQASAWLSAVEGLSAVHSRLKRVAVLNRPAVEVIRQQDGPDTLFYLDPPYLHQTRTARETYVHEMTEADHKELLDVVRMCKGKVMLSGYPSDLYDQALKGWDNAAAGKAKGRETEVVWCNFIAGAASGV